MRHVKVAVIASFMFLIMLCFTYGYDAVRGWKSFHALNLFSSSLAVVLYLYLEYRGDQD